MKNYGYEYMGFLLNLNKVWGKTKCMFICILENLPKTKDEKEYH